MLTFCTRTDWQRGWPLVVAPLRDPSTLIFMTGVTILRTITILQTMVLAFGAAHACGEVVAQIDEKERSEDLLISRSESYVGQF